ncbi:ankyrin repeat domain-containing protein [Emticicia sp. BO119]|uniref:ankyrin repeat domain-containing protein n=1 Tax=Emticicia sp. BO119 TaxID=2757768 RepID=UPI0015F04F02|nr:ankyrin repeat domain-containing protein [Emticicia sp. BO119]MBA4853798.1 ankyrin repeat domain-containing protein [Emticicia sp. BO119]
MEISAIKDPIFRKAVAAIDMGDIALLQNLLTAYPQLIYKRLDIPEEGYFKQPYLIWFVADNPIRNKKLPTNIVAITQLLIERAKKANFEDFQYCIDYTLGLVSTGSVPRDCGVQIELIDLLIDAGAAPGGGVGALAHGNIDAARHLIERGGELTLASAVGLDRVDNVHRLLKDATDIDKEVALMMAAFYGKTDMIKLLIQDKVNVNAYLTPTSGFHSHASALHQAVSSASVESVRVLVEAGASLEAKDLAYGGTPLGWAMYMQTEEIDKEKMKKYAKIEEFLHEKMNL